MEKPTNFIEHEIIKDLGENTSRLVTRFPPEPGGYVHIGSAKAIHINHGIAKHFGGKFHLRMDDTDPTKKDMDHYAESIKESMKWMGTEWDELFYASDYFGQLYEYALHLIRKGVAYVCDLSAEETREYRGTLSESGKNSPYRERSIEENLDLFERMKAGEFPEGARTLRAKIDMTSSNMNMRDPIIYRIIHAEHYNAPGWCIYPTYDYAHPLEDAIEGVTHSLCGMEFEDHRPIYDWCLEQIGFENPPRQIEFAELRLSNAVVGKRHIRKLIADGVIEGWDDPRLMTISGMRRRGYTPESIRDFIEKNGVSKAQSTVDIGFLEFCLREDLALKSKVVMAVLDPIKLIITNYPEGQSEMLIMPNNPKNPDFGERVIPFGRELYIEREDFEEIPPPKYHRLYPGNEVRLAGAYFVTCTDVIKDAGGNVVEIHATYDPETKSGSGFTARKVKGTIHWVSAVKGVPIRANLLDYLFIDDDTAEEGFRLNENSLIITENAIAEPSILNATKDDRLQFMRNAFFCLDEKTSIEDKLAFNRVVEMKSSYKPN